MENIIAARFSIDSLFQLPSVANCPRAAVSGVADEDDSVNTERMEPERKKRKLCPHQRQKSKCKDCGGAGICEHQRVRSTCKDCGGSGICEHQRVRSRCKECGGSSICEHQRVRSKCKECRAAADDSVPAGLEEL